MEAISARLPWEWGLTRAARESFAGPQRAPAEGGTCTCSHAPFSEPRRLNRRLSGRSEVAGQCSKSPKHMDSSFVEQSSFECTLFLSVRIIENKNKVLVPVECSSWCEETSDKPTSRQIRKTSDNEYVEEN